MSVRTETIHFFSIYGRERPPGVYAERYTGEPNSSAIVLAIKGSDGRDEYAVAFLTPSEARKLAGDLTAAAAEGEAALLEIPAFEAAA